MAPVSRFIAVLTGLALASACSMMNSQKTETATSPSVADASNNSTVQATWSSYTSDLPTGQGCSNFKWQISGQTANSLDGTFQLMCLGAITVSGTAHGTISGDNVTITANGTASGQGVPANCTFTLNATGTVQNQNTLPLAFTAQTCMGPISGHETLRKSTPQSPAPPPPPPPPQEPPPPPTPPPAPEPDSPDAINLAAATVVLGPANIARWNITSTVTGTVAVEGNLCIYHTKLGGWPTGPFFGDPYTLVEGNQWVVANIGGHWYAGAADWYRPGQACKDVSAQSIGGDAFYSPSWEPLRSWVPRNGEEFGLFASTPARAWPDMRTLDERSNVVLVRWNQ